MSNDYGRLSKKRIMAFAVGDVFGGGSFNIINFLYPGFLALVVGLPAYLAGIVMLVARVFDAFSDPVMGVISDKVRAKYGSRRVFLVYAAPFVLVALFLMFFPYSNSSLAFRFACSVLSYIFFCTIQTIIMIPYFSLSSEISGDYTERARLNAYRLGMSITSSILCVAVPGLIVNSFSNVKIGYMVMSLSFGTLFMICVFITGFFAKEGLDAVPNPNRFTFQNFFAPLKVKPFRQYLYVFLCSQLTMAIMSGIFFFYVDFYYCSSITASGKTSAIGLISAALMFGMQIVALPLYLKMIEKTSKAFVYKFGSIIWIVSALSILILPANATPILLYVVAGILGFGISAPGLVPHTMFGDIVDVGQLQLGYRAEGAFSGFANLVNKLAQAAGLAIIMTIIGLNGFKERVPGASPVLAQPASAQFAIKMILALAPLFIMSIGVYISTTYKIDEKKQKEIVGAMSGSEDEKKIVIDSL